MCTDARRCIIAPGRTKTNEKEIISYSLFLLIMAIAAGSYFQVQAFLLQLTWRIIVVVFLINIFLIAVVILMERETPTRPSPGFLYSSFSR